MRKILTGTLVFTMVLLLGLAPVNATAYATTDETILSRVTIAAPWDDSITITLTDIHETYYFNDNAVWISLSAISTFSFSADVVATAPGGFSYDMPANTVVYAEWLEGIFDVAGGITIAAGTPNRLVFMLEISVANVDWLERNHNVVAGSLHDRALGEGSQVTQEPAAPDQPIVTFNGQALNFDLPIINRGGRTFYPMRELLNALGAQVEWIDETRIAVGILGGNRVEFPIDGNTYYVNGQARQMDDGLTSFIDSGRTYIPIRSAAEGLGFSVDWDAAANAIVIVGEATTPPVDETPDDLPLLSAEMPEFLYIFTHGELTRRIDTADSLEFVFDLRHLDIDFMQNSLAVSADFRTLVQQNGFVITEGPDLPDARMNAVPRQVRDIIGDWPESMSFFAFDNAEAGLTGMLIEVGPYSPLEMGRMFIITVERM